MQRNGVKVTILEIWFSWHLVIIRELDINNVVVFHLDGCATCGVGLMLFVKNMLRVWVAWHEVIAFSLCISLMFSCLADMKCFLLVCLIRQSKRDIYLFVINIHSIVVCYPFMVCNWGFCRGHWRVPKDVSISWKRSIPHLIEIIRRRLCKKVHPYAPWKEYSWQCKSLIMRRDYGTNFCSRKMFIH